MSDADFSEKSSLPGTKRIEALADGIFAISMTLLVLNLSFPLVQGGTESLRKMLASQVTNFLSYGLSFIDMNMVAHVFFSSNILIIGFLFLINWVYATGNYRLVKHDLDRQIIVNTVRHISVIPIVSLVALIVSLFSPFGSVWLFILIPIIQFLNPSRKS